MARYPKAVWRPLPENSTEPRIDPTQIIYHTAVDAPGPTSLYGYFARGDVNIESTFFIKNSGVVEQYMDTTRQADANYHANIRAISIETEDDGKPIQNPWTPAQITSLVDLTVWLIRTHPKILPRKCSAWDSPGIGWHAMWGAPSHWTPIDGKTCPGSTRIAQIPGIIARVNAILEEDDMELTDKITFTPAASKELGLGDGTESEQRTVADVLSRAYIWAHRANRKAAAALNAVNAVNQDVEVLTEKVTALGTPPALPTADDLAVALVKQIKTIPSS